ncbi:MAG: nitrogenase iron-molybdenum cofactor biosynthesis protein NifE, partial [Proteobacteria bacterium]|nr:nitrogenase iron-molybdenum cofactor biosynthesis protein NifE [Pseudomonadota bacterium]
MEAATLKEIRTEPACEHNKSKELPGCPKPSPGKAAGGCAFDGAYSSLVPITDAAHLVHGPIGCIGNSWNNRGSLTSGPKLYRTAFTTDLNNQDVVFGGEKKLFGAIKEIIENYDPPAVFIYQTCVTAMIGDDLEALCRVATEKFNLPVVPVEAPGFIGTKNFGNRLAGDAVLNHVIGTMEPATSHPFNINFIGEFNIGGEFWSVLPLLDEMGVRVICTLSGDARYHQAAMMHKADLNVMVCSRALLNVAKQMELSYGIPYFEGSFYGAENTRNTLLTIARFFKNDELLERTEKICQRHSDRISHQLDLYKNCLKDVNALLYTGGVKSWSFVGALQELGINVVATGAKKSTQEDKHRIKELMGDDAILITDGSPAKLIDLYQKTGANVLLAGGRNQYTAIKARFPFVHVNQERES